MSEQAYQRAMKAIDRANKLSTRFDNGGMDSYGIMEALQYALLDEFRPVKGKSRLKRFLNQEVGSPADV